MIKIYTTNWCPSCVAAKNLLSELNIDFEEINIEEKGITREKLQKISGQYTVPQIVINDKYQQQQISILDTILYFVFVVTKGIWV